MNQFDILKKNFDVDIKTDFMLKCSFTNKDEHHEISIRTFEKIEIEGDKINLNKIFDLKIDVWCHNVFLVFNKEDKRHVADVRYKLPNE